MIDRLQLIPRRYHADDRGYVTEILRSDEERVAWDAFDDIWTVENR